MSALPTSCSDFHAGVGGAAPLVARGDGEAGPGAFQPVGLVGAVGAGRLELLVQLGLELLGDAVDVLARHRALLDQLVGIDLPRGRVGRDLAIHQRLGEGRLVALVVAEAAVAEHVDDHVALEFLAELHGHARDVQHRFRIVAVDVEDRRLHALGDVRAIGAGARRGRAGGEADLVVDDEMDGAAGPVAVELRHIERFRHQALAGEGGIAVQQQAHHLFARLVVALALLGADLALHHGVGGFQVRGVGGQRQVDDAPVELAVGRGAEVVFDVGRALHVLRVGGVALELGEDRGERLVHEVGQHVEPAAMGHADDHFLHAELAAALDDLLQRRDHGFAAVEAEALGAGVFLVEELLEHLGRGQALQDRDLAAVGEVALVAAAFDPHLQPLALVRILDVHVFDADVAAIGLAQHMDDLAQRRALVAEDVVDMDRAVHVGLGEAEGARVEVGMLGARLRGRADRGWLPDGRARDRRGSASWCAANRGRRASGPAAGRRRGQRRLRHSGRCHGRCHPRARSRPCARAGPRRRRGCR